MSTRQQIKRESLKKRNEKLINGVGFTKEGVIRKAFNKGDLYVDAAVYGMLKDECKWI